MGQESRFSQTAWAIAFATALSISGCVGLMGKPVTKEQVQKVAVGSTADEVKAALGEPFRTTELRDGVTIWDYNVDTMNAIRLNVILRDRVVIAPPWKSNQPMPPIPPRPPKEPADQQTLQAAMAVPLKFSVEKAASDAAWDRARSFVAKYATMKIQTSNDFLVETFNPSDSGVAYKVTRSPLPDGKVEFEAQVFVKHTSMSLCAEQNAHVLAHYAQSGSALCEACICK